MISGGDDLRILLWDMHDTEIKKPQHTFVGPTVRFPCRMNGL